MCNLYTVGKDQILVMCHNFPSLVLREMNLLWRLGRLIVDKPSEKLFFFLSFHFNINNYEVRNKFFKSLLLYFSLSYVLPVDSWYYNICKKNMLYYELYLIY